MNKWTFKAYLRMCLDGYPKAFLFAYRILLGYAWRPTLTSYVTTETDLVIDGFQRSANTYALRAFENAQCGAVSVAHHAHASSQIMAGLRLRLPCVVLIREPCSTVVSYLAAWPLVSPNCVLRMYIVFYERLLPHKADFVVGEFQQVTNDFGSIIREVNTRFEMHFGIFDDTDQQAVRQIRDQLTVGRSSFFSQVDQGRERARLRAIVHDAGNGRLLERAQKVYQAFLA